MTITATALALFVVLVGVAAAFALGWRAKGLGGTLIVLLFDAAMGLALCLPMYIIFSVCLHVGLCAQTTDQTVWSLGYPLVFAPAYWAATLLAKTISILKFKNQQAEGDRS
jgi:hypothetical protein